MMTEELIREDASGSLEVSYGNEWYPIEETDMGHTTDAVSWWNQVSRSVGASPTLYALGC